MVKFLIHRPKWVVAVVGILMFWLTQTEWLTNSDLWQKAEGILIDRRYIVRGLDLPSSEIKLIGLTSTSFQLDALAPEEIAASPTLQKMQQPWPWDRSIYAAILEKLMNAGAKVVMFDFVFASETDGDDALARDLVKYKDHVVIGEMLANNQGVASQSEGSASETLTTPNSRLLLPGSESVVGLVTLLPDVDGVSRRLRYQTSLDRENLDAPNLDPGVAAVLKKKMAAGQSPDDLIHIAALAAEKFQGKVQLPPPGSKTFIDYSGPAGAYRAWPVENMFVDALWQKPPFRGGESVSNKIVIVGPMAEIFHDVHLTPFGETPGPEIQAQVLAGLLKKSWLTATSTQTNFWLAFIAMVVALVICLGIPQALLKGLLLILATVALLVGCQAAFSFKNEVYHMMPALVSLLGTGFFGIVFEYTLEQLERRRYRHLFGRYVSKNVANVILEDTRSLQESLRGQRKGVTILFSDIRNFTTMTETTDPDKLVAQLNEYFDAMIEVIQEKTSGTLQKFIGDAIMAAWGDTHTLGAAEDAKRAVTAALQMREALRKLNTMWKDNPDRKILATGIGVNHGDVIYGNIGSQERTELTVLGDGVNLAARLESSTKQFHTDILVGEEAEKLTRNHFVYRSVAAIAFKGKTKPVETFVLISDRSLPPPAWLEPYHAGIALYRARKFPEAIEMFEKVQNHIGTEDYLCTMYLSRCKALAESGVPGNWDGAFTLSEK